jgi:triosephosphate isomerase
VAGRRLWFFPPAVAITAAAEAVTRREDVTIGAQNVHWEPQGAFTGELSIPLVMEAGARAALIGHSERRHLFGETDEQVGRKLAAALKAGMVPLVCVGETLAEREGGRTEQVVVRQVSVLHERIAAADWTRVVLAYEPVWAIGTGRNATPDDAAQVHELIRFELSRRKVAGRVTILYGGSVNQGNVLSLLARPEIDGVLVGGASLDADGWAELVGLGD